MTGRTREPQEYSKSRSLDYGLELSSTHPNVSNREDVPPDGGYGWICTVCFFLINAHTWGVNSVRFKFHQMQFHGSIDKKSRHGEYSSRTICPTRHFRMRHSLNTL